MGSSFSVSSSRFSSSADSISSVISSWRSSPSDDITDAGVQSVFAYLDSTIVLSRAIYQEGRFPAVDFLSSTSSALNPDVVGEKHYNAVIEAQGLLKKAVTLDRIVSLIGESELSADDQMVYKRARILKAYMTQPFFVIEAQSGRPGHRVDLKDTVDDVLAIMHGECDSFKPEDVMFIGNLKEFKEEQAKESSTASPQPSDKKETPKPAPTPATTPAPAAVPAG